MKITVGFLMMSLLALQASGQKHKIIFVCEHGAAKSVIASNYFNKLATERGLNYEAVCRATVPDSTLSPATRMGLSSDNIHQNKKPQKLMSSDTSNAKRIITFTPLPSNYATNIVTEDWSTVQNVDGTYDQRRDAIVNKINILLDSLEKQQRHE